MKRAKVRKTYILKSSKKLSVTVSYLFQDWIDCDFDDGLNLDFEFAKPLPPKKIPAPAIAPAPRKISNSAVKHKQKAYENNSKIQQWSDRHAPKNSNDLAVNVKKVLMSFTIFFSF